MSEAYEAQGVVHSIGQTTEYGKNGFTKREFVIKLSGEGENPKYPNYTAFELVKDRCGLIDPFSIGDEINVSFNLTGRLWASPGKPERCFNGLQVWKITPAQAAQEQPPAPENFDESRYMPDIPEGNDDVPF